MEYGWEGLYTVGMEVGWVEGRREEGKKGGEERWKGGRRPEWVGERVARCRVGEDSATDENMTSRLLTGIWSPIPRTALP